MDKLPKGDQKIVIKINGEEKDYREDLAIFNWQEAREEVAATTDKERFDRPYPRPRKQMPAIMKKKKSSNTQLSSMKARMNTKFSPPVLIISLISAIIIGVVIGIILLKVMVKEPANSTTEPTGGNKGEETPIVTGEQMVLPSKTIYFLQQGVYKNEDSLNQLVTEYKSSKQPVGYIKNGESYHVFVLLLDKVETGKQMRVIAQYADMWPKEIATNEKIIQDLTKDEKQFLESVFPFYEMLVKETTSSIMNGKEYSFDSNTFTKEYESLKKLTDFKKEGIKNLHSNILKSHDSLIKYFQDPTNENWYESQMSLMEFITNYYAL